MRQWFALADADVVLYAAKVTVWGRWFVWLFGAVILAYRPGLWFPEGRRIPALEHNPGNSQWRTPLPAPDEQAGDVALDVRPQRHGHCADHRQHRRERQIRQLHLHHLLSGPWRLCRDLYVVSAQHGLGDGDCRRSLRRELRRGRRSGPGRGRRKGAGGQGGGDVSHRCGHQPHRPVRTHQEAGRDGKGAAGSSRSASRSPRRFTTPPPRPPT